MSRTQRLHNDSNKIMPEDRPVHDWYRFVLSYPPHLVRSYLRRFDLGAKNVVLDPFCGTGTTIVECKKMGVPSIGIEAHPMSCFASKVKVKWDIEPVHLRDQAAKIGERTRQRLLANGIDDDLPSFQNGEYLNEIPAAKLRTLPAEAAKLLLKDSICPLPLHKSLVLLDCIRRSADDSNIPLFLLALAKALVQSIGNLHFGPEVGVGKPKRDVPVVDAWLAVVGRMASDLMFVGNRRETAATIVQGDSRSEIVSMQDRSIDAVITSPPYPNEKDYTRTTRLESVILGLFQNKSELQSLKKKLLRSNTRGVYKQDIDDKWVTEHPEIQRVSAAIESRRIELGKTSGFERLYARVTQLYFGGMVRHFRELRRVLKPGAQLAYVVGDQASYLRIMIRTGQILADLAQSLGYELEGIDLFRTRLATATKEQLREEVVILRWPGKKKAN